MSSLEEICPDLVIGSCDMPGFIVLWLWCGMPGLNILWHGGMYCLVSMCSDWLVGHAWLQGAVIGWDLVFGSVYLGWVISGACSPWSMVLWQFELVFGYDTEVACLVFLYCDFARWTCASEPDYQDIKVKFSWAVKINTVYIHLIWMSFILFTFICRYKSSISWRAIFRWNSFWLTRGPTYIRWSAPSISRRRCLSS